jgi:arsenate reductase
MAEKKSRILFLCTHNSARSQKAEGMLRALAGDRFEAYSAGCNVGEEIHPYAVEVMEKVGIDLGDQYPKGLRTYMGKMGFNYSIIMCARAEGTAPRPSPVLGRGWCGSSRIRVARTSPRSG